MIVNLPLFLTNRGNEYLPLCLVTRIKKNPFFDNIRDEPMLYHAGMRQTFPAVREAVSKIISPSSIKWIGFSHFEVDECGALNEWLELAPNAQAVCSEAGAIVNMNTDL